HLIMRPNKKRRNERRSSSSNPSLTLSDNAAHWATFFRYTKLFSWAIHARRTCCHRVAVLHGRPAFRRRLSGSPGRTRNQPNHSREPHGLPSGRVDAIRPDPAVGRSRSGADVRRRPSVSLHKSGTGHPESAVRPGDLFYRWANGRKLSVLAASRS